MIQMYRRAANVFRRNFLFFALLASIPVALDAFTTSSTRGLVPKLFIYALMALYCHRLVLSGDKITLKNSFKKNSDIPLEGPMKPFMFRLAGFWAIGALIWGICTFAIFQVVPDTSKIVGLMMIGLLPAGLIIYIFLSLVGTMLPAAAVLQDASFGRALVTGRASFWRTYGKLLMGNGLLSLTSFIALSIIDRQLGLSDKAALFYLLNFLGELTGMFGVLLTATALCIAFENGQAQNDNEAVA